MPSHIILNILIHQDVSGFVPSIGHRTAVYSALLDGEGELLYGVVDSAIFASYHFHQVSRFYDQLVLLLPSLIFVIPLQLSPFYDHIRKAKLVVLDANASIEFMLTASTFCSENNVPGKIKLKQYMQSEVEGKVIL